MDVRTVERLASLRVAGHDRDVAIHRILHAARTHLGLEIGFVSQFVDGQRVFRYVDDASGANVIEVGGSDPLEESYCHYVVNGALPELVPDAAENPVSARLSATAVVGVGTHVSVPIRLSDGRVYGTFCCFARSVRRDLERQHVETVRMLAALATDYLTALDEDERELRQRRDRVATVLADDDGVAMVFQPLVDISSGRTTGVEALARLGAFPEGPQHAFAAAWDVGLGVDLELKAVRAALSALGRLPARLRLNVNVSPATLVSSPFLELVGCVPAGRLTVEVTEHAAVDDYDALRFARDELSSRGIRLAIDDVGMGFSGLNHILESTPDTIKIDAAVVRNVDTNPAKAAMIEALVSFGTRLGIEVLAEGIETAEELAALRDARVSTGQGYFLGRPGDISAIRYRSRVRVEIERGFAPTRFVAHRPR